MHFESPTSPIVCHGKETVTFEVRWSCTSMSSEKNTQTLHRIHVIWLLEAYGRKISMQERGMHLILHSMPTMFSLYPMMRIIQTVLMHSSLRMIVKRLLGCVRLVLLRPKKSSSKEPVTMTQHLPCWLKQNVGQKVEMTPLGKLMAWCSKWTIWTRESCWAKPHTIHGGHWLGNSHQKKH